MRIARVIAALWLAGGLAACQDRSEASAAPDPAAHKAQRQKLESQREVVLEQIIGGARRDERKRQQSNGLFEAAAKRLSSMPLMRTSA